MIKEHYDVVVIGSGPGGSSLAWKLAQTGKSVLVIERGDYLKRERENWDTDEVFAKGRYQAEETWTSSAGDTFRPGLHYFVGGNSKVYGAALFRLREEDFFAVQHADGLSPEWPLKYDVFEPYYQAAEELYEVRGQRGEDPTEPTASGPYKHRPIKHEPRIQQLADDWAREGLQPFHLPIGGLIDQDEAGAATPHSRLLRCDPFDGYPSLTNGKADAQIICLDPALQQWPNLQLLRNAYVSRLLTNAAGNSIAGVETLIEGRTHIIRGDLVVVACGALSSALLFLRSANERHPNGLANGSGQVGRNYMRHHNSTVLAISRSPNPTEFQKTLGLNDFYHGHAKSPRNPHDFPLGHIQMVGKSDGRQIQTEGLPSFLHWLPDQPFEWIARHSIDFWLTSEDLPRPENRIFYRDGQVHLDVQTAHTDAHLALRDMLRQICDKADIHPHLMDRRLYLGKDTPISGTAHQAGTLKFGEDPRATVLDLDCRTHEVDNLYVTDASFFPSVGAVNPTLTIIANSLRVADAIIARLG
ncbi:FAD-dependent oxidoreductase [Pseudomonas rhizoryzae]|uniref:FAD-dependent oxidoreductase n=1 Tax=Pseudomonas rhizoryzae TaxID=2571129 RepID=UPI0010C1BDE7|nr:GMC family oxidoreductase [Pseudomonas rhizoryzae]